MYELIIPPISHLRICGVFGGNGEHIRALYLSTACCPGDQGPGDNQLESFRAIRSLWHAEPENVLVGANPGLFIRS